MLNEIEKTTLKMLLNEHIEEVNGLIKDSPADAAELESEIIIVRSIINKLSLD